MIPEQFKQRHFQIGILVVVGAIILLFVIGMMPKPEPHLTTIDDNLLRRNQNTYQKGVTGLRWFLFYHKLGKENIKATFPKKGHKGFSNAYQETDNHKTIDTFAIISSRVGISRERIAKIKLIEQHGTPEMKKRGREGKSIDELYAKAQKIKLAEGNLQATQFAGKLYGKGHPKLHKDSYEPNKQTLDLIGERVGISRERILKIKLIEQHGTPEMKKQG